MHGWFLTTQAESRLLFNEVSDGGQARAETVDGLIEEVFSLPTLP